jgi:hypothetical protein
LPLPVPPFSASAVVSSDSSVTALLSPLRLTVSCVDGSENSVVPNWPSISSWMPLGPETVLIVIMSPPALAPL